MTRLDNSLDRQTLGKARGADLGGLVLFLNVSVRWYANGSMRAQLGRLDRASNRMVFTSLPHPEYANDCPHPEYHQLAEAAVEALEEIHSSEPSLW